MSPGPQLQQQQPVQQQPGAGGTVGTSGRTTAPAVPLDQGKISVFQGALSSPNRRCLHAFGIAPSGFFPPLSDRVCLDCSICSVFAIAIACHVSVIVVYFL